MQALTAFVLISKLKPLYKELLYTITHKMGKASSDEVFTDSQLHEYVKEVNPLGFTRK